MRCALGAARQNSSPTRGRGRQPLTHLPMAVGRPPAERAQPPPGPEAMRQIAAVLELPPQRARELAALGERIDELRTRLESEERGWRARAAEYRDRADALPTLVWVGTTFPPRSRPDALPPSPPGALPSTLRPDDLPPSSRVGRPPIPVAAGRAPSSATAGRASSSAAAGRPPAPVWVGRPSTPVAAGRAPSSVAAGRAPAGAAHDRGNRRRGRRGDLLPGRDAGGPELGRGAAAARDDRRGGRAGCRRAVQSVDRRRGRGPAGGVRPGP